ncbi:MAG: hypothetical protein MSC31_03720 [Solirubrobacteraceae bacterium MAG38_C4-C5]|nr:hypothetical protein [Candidatus Siliceabacter maunaloa]
MSTGEHDNEELSPAERELVSHLAVMAVEPRRFDRALSRRVVGAARWQRAVRAPLRLAGVFVSALRDAIGPLLGRRSAGGRR